MLCFIWFVIFLLLSTTFAWLSFIDFLLTSCCGIHNCVLVIHFSFTNYVPTPRSEVLKCGLRPDIGKSTNELHLFTRHFIHEHGIEISIMLQLLKTIVTNDLVTWGWLTFESIVNNLTGCWHMSYIKFWFAIKFYNWCVMCMLCDFQN
jgi:hypothetical protein